MHVQILLESRRKCLENNYGQSRVKKCVIKWFQKIPAIDEYILDMDLNKKTWI